MPGAHVLLNRPGASNKHNSIVEIENFSGTPTDWVISGFEIANSPKYAIEVRVTDRITVQNNHVHDSKLTGIFTAFFNYVLIENNETDHNHEHGIYQATARFPSELETQKRETLPTVVTRLFSWLTTSRSPVNCVCSRSHHNPSAGIDVVAPNRGVGGAVAGCARC